MKPAPMTASLRTRVGATPGGRRAPLLSSPVDTNRVRIIAKASGERSTLANRRLSILRPEVDRHLQALVDGGQQGAGGRIIVLRLAPVDGVGGGPDHHALRAVHPARRQFETLLIPDRDGRSPTADPGFGLLYDLAGRRHRMHEAHRLGSLGPDLIALEHHLQGVARRHQPCHALRPAGAREQADLDLGQTHTRGVVIGQHAMVARERKLERAAEAQAVDRGRPGFAAGLELAVEHRQPPRAVEEGLGGGLDPMGPGHRRVVGAEALEHGEIGAAREGGLGRGDDAALEGSIASHVLDDAVEFVHDGLGG